jgi:hypothetical protein
MDLWKDLSNVPFPPLFEDVKLMSELIAKEVPKDQLSLAQLKRLSVVRSFRKTNQIMRIYDIGNSVPTWRCLCPCSSCEYHHSNIT